MNNSSLKNPGLVPSLYDISFPTPTIGYIGGDTGTLLKSVDSGQNWNSISITLDNVAANFPLGAIHDLTFINENYGYMLMAEPNFSLFSPTPLISTLWETQNGGLNWRQIEGNNSSLLSSLNMTSLYVKDTSNLFLGERVEDRPDIAARVFAMKLKELL